MVMFPVIQKSEGAYPAMGTRCLALVGLAAALAMPALAVAAAPRNVSTPIQGASLSTAATPSSGNGKTSPYAMANRRRAEASRAAQLPSMPPSLRRTHSPIGQVQRH